ncbi:unnamed protein product [Heligmosomoides polygyrus]|uniref:Uncharacterized protein n=1 Tax=Heligmosomoides polygyrus TaxID=6339 RepID=A0A183GFQ7_HELPZ|nr:unnamed protein product [Heligmosomoides polygyrus]
MPRRPEKQRLAAGFISSYTISPSRPRTLPPHMVITSSQAQRGEPVAVVFTRRSVSTVSQNVLIGSSPRGSSAIEIIPNGRRRLRKRLIRMDEGGKAKAHSLAQLMWYIPTAAVVQCGVLFFVDFTLYGKIFFRSTNVTIETPRRSRNKRRQIRTPTQATKKTFSRHHEESPNRADRRRWGRKRYLQIGAEKPCTLSFPPPSLRENRYGQILRNENTPRNLTTTTYSGALRASGVDEMIQSTGSRESAPQLFRRKCPSLEAMELD